MAFLQTMLILGLILIFIFILNFSGVSSAEIHHQRELRKLKKAEERKKLLARLGLGAFPPTFIPPCHTCKGKGGWYKTERRGSMVHHDVRVWVNCDCRDKINWITELAAEWLKNPQGNVYAAQLLALAEEWSKK